MDNKVKVKIVLLNNILFTCEMLIIPRVGEVILLNEENYEVRKIVHDLDNKTKIIYVNWNKW